MTTLAEPQDWQDLVRRVGTCSLCADDFAATAIATAHEPRPVFRARSTARVLIAGQAPGARADRSPTLRATGRATFWEWMMSCFMIVTLWRSCRWPSVFRAMTRQGRICRRQGAVRNMAGKGGVTRAVVARRNHASAIFPLPHPFWRNTAWLRKKHWFEADLLPAARQQLRDVLSGD